MSQIFDKDLESLDHWLSSSWFQNIKNLPYQADLRSLILQLWPERKANTNPSKAYTFLNVPALCYRALGGASDVIFPVNCAWILLYAAFYLLDKVEDQETGHILFSHFGGGPLTNLTTGLMLNAGWMLSSTVQAAPGNDSLRAIQADFYRLAVDVCAGQHLDLTIKEPDLKQAWEIATAKSGNFFALGCRMGARLGTEAHDQLDAFTRYGRNLGTLIQVANDYEGLFPNEYGKSDIIIGKYNLPIAYCFQVLPEPEKSRLSELLQANAADTQAKQRAQRMVIQSGALLYLYLEAEKHKTLAAKALEPLALALEEKELLLSIPEKIIGGLRQSGT